MTPVTRPLVRLPKAHLHVHLEGAMRLRTLAELCRAQGTAVPVPAQSYGSFADFQELYLTARFSLRTLDDLVRLVTEVVEDAAADGAVWIEPAIHVPGHHRLGSDEVILDTIIEAGRRATAATGVGVGWLVSVDRTLAPEAALEQAALAARYVGRGVTTMGLANDEAAAPPELFGPAFALARGAGIISAPHAGEHSGPSSVRGALDALGADRVQHGVRAAEDPALVQRLAAEEICLDVAPTSNVALSVVSGFDDHPLPLLLAAGVPCSINADDPLLFGVGLLDEYTVCRQTLGLDDAALASCARASIVHSGAPDEIKAEAGRAIDRWLISSP